MCVAEYLEGSLSNRPTGKVAVFGANISYLSLEVWLLNSIKNITSMPVLGLPHETHWSGCGRADVFRRRGIPFFGENALLNDGSP